MATLGRRILRRSQAEKNSGRICRLVSVRLAERLGASQEIGNHLARRADGAASKCLSLVNFAGSLLIRGKGTELRPEDWANAG